MEGFTHPSGADRELDELRARAYGPDPDIGGDPAALARLRELEAAHLADVESRADAPTISSAAGTDVAPSPPVKTGSWRSLIQRATATRWSRVAWSVGALVVAGWIVATVLIVSAPRPDATLHPTAAEADDQVRRLVVEEAPWHEIDASTLIAYGSFLGLEIWSGVNAFDSPCLVAVHRANDNLSESSCAPPAADLIMDVSSTGDGFEGFDGVAGDGIIRFMLHGDTVDAYVYLLPEAD
ncbi:hypothetical protein [Cryobacterium sp. N22]|uniref:hypothetical protein n=1 Tax=Cryobacterium sp. N22 TaxID=2048290 RepID=UPI000CE4FBE8|nr:hypothetical protein [Cryobacterium sp. N22]